MAKADVKAGAAYVSLYTKNDAFTRGLQKAKSDLNKFGSDMVSLGSKMVAMSAAIATPIAFATKTFSDFDDGMRMVGAVSQATAAELASMTAVAKELGRTTSFTAIEIANLMAEIGRAGFKPDQVNAMTGAVLNLARATGTDATLASGIMAATIRQFSLDASEAARVADVLTMGANATFNSVESLGEALGYAGPVAKELGMSLEDTVAILGTLGNVGIQGSNAGTALRRLGVISAATGEKLKETFNVSNVDATGKLKPLVQIMGEIGAALEKLPLAERTEKMNDAFGLLGITSASVLSHTAADTMALAEALKHADGTAAKTAKSMDAGLGGAFRIIWSAVEGLRIELGEALSGAIKGVTDAMTGLIGQATAWVKQNQGVVVSVAAVTAALGAAGVAILSVGIAAKVAAGGVGLMVTAIVIAKSVILAALAGPLMPLVVALGSLAAAAAYVTIRGKDFSAAWTVVTATLSDVMAIAKRVGAVLMSALAEGDYDIAFGVAMAGVKLALATAIDGMSKLWSMFWNGAWEMTKKFFSNFTAITLKVVTAIAKAIANPLQAADAIKGALGDIMSGKIGIGIDTDGIRDSANKELDQLEKELEARKAKREAEQKAKEGTGGDTGGGPGAAPGAGGDGAPFGNGVVEDSDEIADAAEAGKTAFDRETEALERQIIALKEGEDAAERFRLKKEGLTDAEIAKIMALRAEEAKLKKEQEDAINAIREGANQPLPTVRSGGASAATFSAQSLVSMGTSSGVNGQLQVARETKRAIDMAARIFKEKADEQIAAIKNNGLHHA